MRRRISVALLLLLSSCEGERRVPRARDFAGRIRSWRSSAVVQLDCARELFDTPAGAALKGAVAAWNQALGGLEETPAELRLRFVDVVTSNEDARNVIAFVEPSRSCRSRMNAIGPVFCLEQGQLGVTRLLSRPVGSEAEIVEVDVLLNRSLLYDPQRLEEVALHELGHVLGLDHISESTGRSIMTTIPPRDVEAPGEGDVASFEAPWWGN